MLYLKTFGGLTIERDGVALEHIERFRKRLSLLAVLAASDSGGMPREALLELLWPERDTARARSCLKQAVFGLRRDLETRDVIVGVAQLRLNEHLIGSDIRDFRAAMAAGDLSRAIVLQAGRFLDGVFLSEALEFDAWIESVRSSVVGAIRSAAATAAAREQRAANWAHAAVLWEHAARVDPLGADAACAYITALARSGNETRALEYARDYETRVRAELDVSVDNRVVAVAEDIRRGRLASPVSVAAMVAGRTPPRCGLPHVHGMLIGRQAEAERLRVLLADSPLVTIAGPLGAGKTRLALDVAASVEDTLRDGACYVALSGIADAARVVPCIAEAVGCPLVPSQDAAQQLMEHLREQRMLLVLDGFEQVLGASAFVARIAAECEHVRLLVTSREPLGIAAEALVMIGGLGTDAAHGAEPAAVQLFIRRAKLADPTFAPGVEDREAIATICRAVAGLPFAIELAAPFVRGMPCRQLAEEIERDPDMLALARRDLPERQRSLCGMNRERGRAMVNYWPGRAASD